MIYYMYVRNACARLIDHVIQNNLTQLEGQALGDLYIIHFCLFVVVFLLFFQSLYVIHHSSLQFLCIR